MGIAAFMHISLVVGFGVDSIHNYVGSDTFFG